MAKTIQTGAKTNLKNFQNFSWWLGGIDVSSQNLDSFNGYIKGISRLFLHKPPHYMNVIYPQLTKNFKTYMEAGFTRIDGIGDIDVEFVDYEGGFAGQRYSTVSLARDTTEEITVSAYELSGSPLREYVDTWVSGVRDFRSGVAHYHGALQSGAVNHYGEINHTCEFIYTAMDPTALHLEYTCLLAQGFPGRVEKSHLNFETGDRGNVLYEIPFRIKLYESPVINDVGNWYLAASRVDYNYLNYNPNITQAAVNANAITYGNSSGN